MTENDTSGQETDGAQPAHRNDLAAAASENTLKRARWEHLRLGACAGEHRVNVENRSYGDDAGEHTYTVTIAQDGLPESCTCPADEYQPGPCKHACAVADAPDVVADAMHSDDPEPADGDESPSLGPDTDTTTMADKLRADGRIVATDGGAVVTESDETPTCDRCGSPPDIGTEFAGSSGLPYCSAYDELCGECLLDHGPDACEHDGDDDTTETEGYERPTRSEPADFGGGESSGVDEL